MKLENQITSLELSKQLQKTKIPQKSLFYWCEYTYYNDERELTTDWVLKNQKQQVKEVGLCMSAFTCSELGEMLPQLIRIDHKTYQLFCSVALDKQWFVVYANEHDYSDNAPLDFKMCHNEADARAKMLLMLIQKKFISPSTLIKPN